jgi:hypothetical protein
VGSAAATSRQGVARELGIRDPVHGLPPGRAPGCLHDG